MSDWQATISPPDKGKLCSNQDSGQSHAFAAKGSHLNLAGGQCPSPDPLFLFYSFRADYRGYRG